MTAKNNACRAVPTLAFWCLRGAFSERVAMKSFTIPENLCTPCYVVDTKRLQKNTTLLRQIQTDTGCKILLAQKAFSMFSAYPLIRGDLAGTSSSGLFEARLGHTYFGKETHVFQPAYPPQDFPRLLQICDHVVFNSFGQWKMFREQVYGAEKKISCGMRVNPGYAEVETPLYNPCLPGSRLGVPLEQMEPLDDLEGIHFHTMCEQSADVLARTLDHMLPRFDRFLRGAKWVNFGGGQLITRAGYDVETLARCIQRVQKAYDVQVYLEPGEAIALDAGFLVATVLDIVRNGMDIAILDASAACHMPDVLEMPYRPLVQGAGKPGEKTYTYRLAGNTCLAGDVIGDYSFDAPLRTGSRLVFCDMAIYTMVKNNTFNGMPLPDIVLHREDGAWEVIRHFGYADFQNRLS